MDEVKSKKSFKDRLKTPGKRVFWVWVTYQAIKGTLTLSFIWIPLLYLWFFK